MNNILSYFALRTVATFASTAFALLVVMLALNIVTVDEVVKILNLSPDAANAFKQVISRIQEVTGNIMQIISQLMNKLFGWAGVDVDLNKIKFNVNPVDSGSVAGSAPEISDSALPQE
jgi:hypothetical protein